MAKQNNDHDRIKELWNSSLDEVNTGVNVSSTSVVAGSLKKHIDHIKTETDLNWYPEEGYDALKDKIKLANFEEGKRKAEEQGFFGEAGGFLAQGASEIVLGTLEGVGYLVDDVFNAVSGGEKDYSNWFSDAMSGANDWVKENAPIYQDPLNKERSTWQNMIHGDGWWAQNGVSLTSAVSLMIPVAGAARALGFVGKAGKVLGTAGKVGKLGKVGKIVTTPINLIDDVGRAMGFETKLGKQITNGISKSIISRHLENNIEAADVFKQKYDEYINLGMSQEDAKKHAGTAASFTYNAGWANIWQDALQYTLLAKGFNISKGVTSAKQAKAAGTSTAKALTYNMGRKGFEFITEGMEEAYQFIVAEEGKHLADVQAGLVSPEESTLSDRLKKYSEDSELWTSAFFGGLGGNVFSTALPAINKLTDKLGSNTEDKLDENQARLKELLTWKERESQAIRDYFESQQIDDEKGFEIAKTKMSFNTGVRAAMEGNWAIRKGQLEDLKKATPEEVAQTLNIPIEAVDDYIANIDNHIKTSEEAAKLYASNVNKYGESIAYQVSYLQHMTNHYNNKIPELGKVIEDEIQKVPGVNNLTPQGKQIFNSRLTTLAAKKVINYNKNLVEKKKGLSDSDREYYNKRNEYLDTIIDNNDKTIEEAKGLGVLSPNDRIALSYLSGGVTDELVNASIEKELAEMYVDKWLEDIDNLTSKDAQNKIKAKQEEVSKKQQDKIKKETNKQNAETANQKANKIPDYKPAMDLEEAEIGSQEEESKPVDFKDLHKLIEEGQVDVNQLDTPVLEAYNNWKSQNINVSEDVVANEENITSNLNNIETQVSDNIEDYIKGSDDISTVTQVSTPLAYLSVNNSRATEEDKTPENIALSNFLESGEPINDIDIVFEIDFDFLNKENPEGWKTKPVDTILASLNSNKPLTTEQLEVLPVKGMFYKNNEPFIYNDIHLRMHIHEADFFRRIPNTSAEFQIEKSLQHKQLILDAYNNKQKLKSSLISKSNGTINNDSSDNAFNKNILSDVIKKSYENMEFFYGDAQGSYLKPNKKLSEDFQTLFSSTKGSVYIKVETANGKAFPLRLKSSKVSEAEAELIYSLYITIMKDFSYLNKPVNTKLENEISLGDTIRSSDQAIIKGLNNYLNFDKITYNQLLNHLIFEGKTTANKKESRLMLMASQEVEGKKIPPTLVFGDNRLALKELLLDDNKIKFIENLTTNRNRQIDINYLGDNTYKEYIDVNKIVTTNIIPSDTGVIFIQPVIEYNDNLIPFKEETTEKEVFTPKENLMSSEEIDEGTDLSALILKALEKNNGNPISSESQSSTSFLDSINNAANEAEEDGETPLFKIMVPETNSISITKEEIEDIKRIIPTDVPVIVVDDYIKVLNKGSYAIGMFKNSMITLSTKAYKGTGYHEAFHSVFRTMLSSEEQTEYINEIKNMSKVPTKEQLEDIQINNQVNEKEATNIYYEEIMADEFALYKTDINNSKFRKEYPKSIKGFFNRVLDFINNIFNNDRKVEILFDNIAKGKYNKKSKTISDITADVILPIGTSGSGKSTWIKSINKDNKFTIISPDEMRIEFTGDINNKSKDKEIYTEAANRAVKAIKKGKQVIFDTTNLTKEKRMSFTQAIKKALPTASIQYKLMELNPKQPKVEVVVDNSFERDLGYYKGDIALMEQEEGFNFTEYEITPEEWLSLSKEEKSKIIKCK